MKLSVSLLQMFCEVWDHINSKQEQKQWYYQQYKNLENLIEKLLK